MSASARILLALLLASAAPVRAAPDAGPEEARTLLQRAFDRTLHAPGIRSVELRVHRGGRLVSRRAFDLAYRRDAVGARSLLRFTAPSYLRGHTLLVLEAPGGVSDTWLYQTEERRPRRVASTQKADAFYGSDLSLEELEHPQLEHWTLRALPDATERGAACAVLEAFPRPDSQYGRLVVWVERSRAAIARIDFFRRGAAQPTKRLRVTLSDVAEESGFLRIRHLRVEQVGRDAWTEVETSRMVIDPTLPAELFSASLLERERGDLYALLRRTPVPSPAP